MALVPIPIIFYFKGHIIRERSAFAPTHGHATQAATHHSDEDLNKTSSESGNANMDRTVNANADLEKQK